MRYFSRQFVLVLSLELELRGINRFSVQSSAASVQSLYSCPFYVLIVYCIANSSLPVFI